MSLNCGLWSWGRESGGNSWCLHQAISIMLLFRVGMVGDGGWQRDWMCFSRVPVFFTQWNRILLILYRMLASWNVAKPSPITFFSLPPLCPMLWAWFGEKVSKTNSCFSNHWVFILSHWSPLLIFFLPIHDSFGGFSKYVCKQLEIQLEPEPLVKSYWIVISWLY